MIRRIMLLALIALLIIKAILGKPWLLLLVLVIVLLLIGAKRR